jgi:antitoxin HicB
MRDFGYWVALTPDDNGTLLVTSRDLPEVTSFGETKAEALSRASDAVEEALAARIAAREPIPEGKRRRGGHFVAIPLQTAAKVALYQAMREQGVKKAELQRRLAVHAPQIDRLLDVRHASRLDQIESALAVLGKRLVVDIVDAD